MEVITLNTTEASSVKQATVFDNFMYEQQGAIAQLDSIRQNVSSLNNAIESCANVITLIGQNYQQFTDYVNV